MFNFFKYHLQCCYQIVIYINGLLKQWICYDFFHIKLHHIWISRSKEKIEASIYHTSTNHMYRRINIIVFERRIRRERRNAIDFKYWNVWTLNKYQRFSWCLIFRMFPLFFDTLLPMLLKLRNRLSVLISMNVTSHWAINHCKPSDVVGRFFFESI